MRSATQEERESVDKYIESISIQTGVTFNGALHGEIPQLTFEQLKAEADRQGYNLVKKRQYVKFLPCTCGCNRRYTFYSMERITWNVGYKCARCGKEAFGKSAEDAKLNWNELIRREQNECE